jgi:hypothetical protein
MSEMSYGLVAFTTVMIGFSFLVLLVGMIKPKWVLFWMKEPNRLIVSTVALVMFMVFFTWHTSLVMPAKKAGGVSQARNAPDRGGHGTH